MQGGKPQAPVIRTISPPMQPSLRLPNVSLLNLPSLTPPNLQGITPYSPPEQPVIGDDFIVFLPPVFDSVDTSFRDLCQEILDNYLSDADYHYSRNLIIKEVQDTLDALIEAEAERGLFQPDGNTQKKIADLQIKERYKLSEAYIEASIKKHKYIQENIAYVINMIAMAEQINIEAHNKKQAISLEQAILNARLIRQRVDARLKFLNSYIDALQGYISQQQSQIDKQIQEMDLQALNSMYQLIDADLRQIFTEVDVAVAEFENIKAKVNIIAADAALLQANQAKLQAEMYRSDIESALALIEANTIQNFEAVNVLNEAEMVKVDEFKAKLQEARTIFRSNYAKEKAKKAVADINLSNTKALLQIEYDKFSSAKEYVEAVLQKARVEIEKFRTNINKAVLETERDVIDVKDKAVEKEVEMKKIRQENIMHNTIQGKFASTYIREATEVKTSILSAWIEAKMEEMAAQIQREAALTAKLIHILGG